MQITECECNYQDAKNVENVSIFKGQKPGGKPDGNRLFGEEKCFRGAIGNQRAVISN